MKKYRLILISVLCLISISYSSLITTPINPNAINATVIDFDNFKTGEYKTPITIGDVTFNTNDYFVITNNGASGMYNTKGVHLENTSTGFTSIDFDFSYEVSSFGFNIGGSNEDWKLEAFDASNNLIEVHTLPQTWNSNNGDFFGIRANGITKARLTQLTFLFKLTDYVLFDNFSFTTPLQSVPEPGTIALLSIGLFFIGLIRKKAH